MFREDTGVNSSHQYKSNRTFSMMATGALQSVGTNKLTLLIQKFILRLSTSIGTPIAAERFLEVQLEGQNYGLNSS